MEKRRMDIIKIGLIFFIFMIVILLPFESGAKPKVFRFELGGRAGYPISLLAMSHLSIAGTVSLDFGLGDEYSPFTGERGNWFLMNAGASVYPLGVLFSVTPVVSGFYNLKWGKYFTDIESSTTGYPGVGIGVKVKLFKIYLRTEGTIGFDSTSLVPGGFIEAGWRF